MTPRMIRWQRERQRAKRIEKLVAVLVVIGTIAAVLLDIAAFLAQFAR
jgi:hypothetical protein